MCTASFLAIFLLGLFPAFTQSSNNGPKIISLNVDKTSGDEGEIFSFTAELAGSDGDLYLYSWDFGDGTRIVNRDNLQAYKHRFEKEGDLTVTLTVTNSDGQSDTKSVIVKVANVPPEIIAIDRKGAPIKNQPLKFIAHVFDIDDLTYTWDFGDGTTKGPIKDRSHIEYTYKQDGRYTLELTVNDGIDETKFEETIVVGQGLEFTVSGDLSFSYESKQDKQDFYLTGLPVSTGSDGDLSYRLDLDAALNSENAAVGDGSCLITFGNHFGFTEGEFYLKLSSAPHNILNTGITHPLKSLSQTKYSCIYLSKDVCRNDLFS